MKTWKKSRNRNRNRNWNRNWNRNRNAKKKREKREKRKKRKSRRMRKGRYWVLLQSVTMNRLVQWRVVDCIILTRMCPMTAMTKTTKKKNKAKAANTSALFPPEESAAAMAAMMVTVEVGKSNQPRGAMRRFLPTTRTPQLIVLYVNGKSDLAKP